jgi:hypothetical protein
MQNDNFELDDLLAAHLDALIAAQPTDTFYRGLTRANDGQALELLHVANQLQRALTPVEPSAHFLADLRAEFVTHEPKTLALRWRGLPAQYRLAARLGGGALTAGLVLLAVRRSLLMLANLRSTGKHAEPNAGVKVTP